MLRKSAQYAAAPHSGRKHAAAAFRCTRVTEALPRRAIIVKMKWLSTLLAAAALTAAPAYTPTQSEIDQIRTKLADLNKTIDQLHSRHADEALAADVEVYKKAADYILRFRDEFYTQAYVNNTLSALDTCIARGK